MKRFVELICEVIEEKDTSDDFPKVGSFVKYKYRNEPEKCAIVAKYDKAGSIVLGRFAYDTDCEDDDNEECEKEKIEPERTLGKKLWKEYTKWSNISRDEYEDFFRNEINKKYPKGD